MKFVCVFLILLTCLDMSGSSDRYSISHLGVEHGLSNNHVVGIAQDKNGFIWIATDEGLNRYDGHSFKPYYKDESGEGESLTGNELNAILDDPMRPILWIATARGGLNAYNYETDTFTSYRHNDTDDVSLITDDVTSLSPASDGGVWVTTFWRGFDHFDPDTKVFTHYSHENISGLPNAPVWSMCEGSDGLLYIGQERAGFSVVNPVLKTAVNYTFKPDDPHSLPDNDVECVFIDSINNIWVGTKEGLSLFNPDSGTFVNFGLIHPQLRNKVSDIRQFADDKLWVAMERGGVATLELNDTVYTSPLLSKCYNIGEGKLSSPSVRTLFLDNYSNVWAGTWGGGVNLISENVPVFKSHPLTSVQSDTERGHTNSVLTLLYDSDNRLWVGKDSGGLYMQEDGSEDAKFFSLSNPNGLEGVVQSSYESREGDLWFGVFFGGAYRYDKSRGKFEQIFPKENMPDVRDITGDKDGNIIIGTSSGVWRYSPVSKAMSGAYAVGNNLVRKVFPLSDDKFLIGTFGDGLILTDKDFNELAQYNVATGYPSNTINDIYRSRDGQIWVATGEGLLEFHDFESSPTEYTLYNRASGLGNAHVLAIIQDRSGAIWVSTNGGISAIKDGEIYNYSHRDKVSIGNFLGKSVASDPQGNLYFGAISGLCFFNPVKVFEKVELPSPMIVEITVTGKSGSSSESPEHIQVAGKQEIRLKAGQNSLDISFATGNFSYAKEVDYAYMLEGYDNRWITTRDNNFVSFRNLSPGKYVFKVKTRIRNQEWGEPTELKIVLPPPFYISWWAKVTYLAIFLCIVGVLLYFYRKRINAEAQLQAEKEQHRKEQELNDERLRFYTNITHELRTPLTLIMGPLEDMSKEKSIPDKDRRSLAIVCRNAARLLDLVNRILEFRKTETQNRKLCVREGNIADTIYEIALKYKELNRNPDVKITISIHPDDIRTIYDKEVVTMILDNLLSNATKYTKSGSIAVSCSEEDGKIEISVKDTGVGISPDAIPRIFERYYQEKGPHQAAGTGIGLALVKNLVALHHGVIAVSSVEGKGSEFVVTLPASDSYPEALHPDSPTRSDGQRQSQEVTIPLESNRKPLVLVVEDNEDIRDYLKQAFTDLYDIRTADNGKDGLKLATEIMPSVIVCDIMMPVMDGIEMTKHLKEDVRTSHIPVIMLTAKGTSSDREEGYMSGADSYLVKPFSASLLQTRINNLLQQRMKLLEKFSSHATPVSESSDNTLEYKREKLMKSLNEVDRKFVEKLNKTITDNLPSENVDVNFLAGVFCMSSSTLYRKVKALTGLSPNEYIRKIKMQLAENLLLEGKFTFSEIAYKVGMNSVAYFRSCFKDEFGMTPTEYMKRISPPAQD